MIIYTAEALADLVRLRKWLRERDARLVARFSAAVARSDAQIALRPTAHPAIGDGVTRKRLMRFGRYAYVFYFQIEGEDQIILRVWHGRERRA